MAGKAGTLAALRPDRLLGELFTQPDISKLISEKLHREHPRLHLRKSQWDVLREAIRQDTLLTHWYEQLQQTAATMLAQPTAQYKLVGPRLLYESRAALARISVLAGLYRLDGDLKKADRAREELRAICAFPSWHPPHFLDVAEMTNAAALGYDWIYEVLSEEERRTIRLKIVEFGLRPGLAEYSRGVSWSLPFANNWGQVCAGGLTVGALAIAQDGADDPGGLAPEPAHILALTTEKIRNPMMNYAPDGGWPEGPGYWSYATNYTCYMLSALLSALNTDLDLSEIEGFAQTGDFRVASIGPSGQQFNYADAGAKTGVAPEMLWLGKRFNKPLYITSECSVVSRAQPGIFHLVWSSPHTVDIKSEPLPVDINFKRIDLAYFRSSWTDPNAVFVGFKGGSNKVSHGHLDLGTFVLDAAGERWAIDLGPDDYDLPGYFGAQRWDYYRLRTEGHNTLSIGDDNQITSAKAPLADFKSTAQAGQATVDLTEAYSSWLRSVRRTIVLERQPQTRVVITDTITKGTAQTVRWNMHTSAEVTIQANSATLRLNGKSVRLTAESPKGGKFSTISADPPKPQGQQPNVKNLIMECPINDDRELPFLIRVTFTFQP
ncbi:MAG: heparinase II/III family protein [Edaphobacter sp.]|uniref:heparinase II/III domain-containing protein n=1 Tax=Edaphobacter sp. TaxID=1934404 RepID=UPI0023877B2C|nr:heparinase II/III family protein [Edaphobacter sp.]MDE1175840.1 heparinase II/III family protein [Edaphobacter sp.]